MAKSDLDVIRENFQFIREDGSDPMEGPGSAAVGPLLLFLLGGSVVDDRSLRLQAALSKRYYDRLYREYALADLSRYKLGQVGLRWRTEVSAPRCSCCWC